MLLYPNNSIRALSITCFNTCLLPICTVRAKSRRLAAFPRSPISAELSYGKRNGTCLVVVDPLRKSIWVTPTACASMRAGPVIGPKNLYSPFAFVNVRC